MQLLVLESTNDDPVVKSSVKGLAMTTVKAPIPSAADTRITRTMTANSDRPSPLEHVSTSNSIASLNAMGKVVTSTNLEQDARVLYPFRIKHLGKSEIYTLYAPTAQNREDWCDKILEAKTRHAASLFAQNAEPFRLKVLADTAFAYDGISAGTRAGGMQVSGTPLDRAIRDMDILGGARPGPVCRAQVNCATGFTCYGKTMVAIGTDYGVYTSETSNPRGWTRVSDITSLNLY